LIIDCFTYFNEKNLLNTRLSYLYDHVDKFIISEANMTHSGGEKPYNLEAAVSNTTHWNKIEYIQVDLNGLKPGWERENAQRDALSVYRKVATKNQWVMVSDLDEIPSLSAIRYLAKVPTNNAFIHFEQLYCYFKLNNILLLDRRKGRTRWYGTAAVRASENLRPEFIRQLRQPGSSKIETCGLKPLIIQTGGWHITAVGPLNWDTQKMNDGVHAQDPGLQKRHFQTVKDAYLAGSDFSDPNKIFSSLPLQELYDNEMLSLLKNNFSEDYFETQTLGGLQTVDYLLARLSRKIIETAPLSAPPQIHLSERYIKE
jgi:beta-1,4-mannosyl-glycoprotein beta-1,4-N-acetylglucosaminyltransferase